VSLLLDTHIVLWWLTDDPSLADDVKDRLDREIDAYVSSATVWEVAIKQALGSSNLPICPSRYAIAGSGCWTSLQNTG